MSDEQKSAKELELEAKQKEADAINKDRTGVGTRVRVGQTRGKNPIVISWEAFDESQPATLPTTMKQFMEVTEVKDEPSLVSFLIGGLNDANYTAASDPLAEFVDLSWPQDAQTQFRLVVRNYSRGANVSLDDAVKLIKPGFVKQFSVPATAEPAASEQPATEQPATA
jgi:hypothetical protein